MSKCLNFMLLTSVAIFKPSFLDTVDSRWKGRQNMRTEHFNKDLILDLERLHRKAFSWLTNKLKPISHYYFWELRNKDTVRGRRHKPLISPPVSQYLTLISQAPRNKFYHFFSFLCSSFLSVQSHNNKTRVVLRTARI